MSSKNPWLTHVEKFRKKHPDLSYREVLVESRKTYTPVDAKKTKTQSVGRDKSQKGGAILGDGKWTAISSLGDTARGVIGDISKTVTTQMDKNGTSNSRIANRRRALFRQLKVDMKQGNFPKMNDEKLLAYVEKEIPLH